jgi:hypothetical protein
MHDSCGPYSGLNWRRSRFCVGDGHCVEVAYGDGCVYLRNSQSPDHCLCLTQDAWQSMIACLRSQ